MSILTPAELRSLVLTLVFLAVGAGARLWQSSQVRMGPYLEDPAGIAAAVPPASDSAAAVLPAAAPAGSPLPPPGDLPGSPPPGPASPAGWPDGGRLVHGSLTAPTMPLPSGTGARPPRPSRPAARREGRGEAAPRKTSTVKVALNRAGVAELAQVPGIGEKTARAILAYREAHGPFMDLRELLHVKGIGEKKLERIAPCLVLSPVREEEPARQAGLPP